MDPAPSFLSIADGNLIAYHRLPGKAPCVVFLGGFMSDMTGTKAMALETFCRSRGQAFVRFDYFAHGASSGAFEEATVGRWKADALAVIDRLTDGPLVLVGSSIGGWIMTLAARERPDRVHGLVGIASAPDATEKLMLPRLSPDQRQALEREGKVLLPSAYDPGGYTYTLKLIEDGRRHLVLGGPIPIACPVRLIHGLADPDVPWSCSVELAERLAGEATITLVKDGDHRLSSPADLERLTRTLAELLDR